MDEWLERYVQNGDFDKVAPIYPFPFLLCVEGLSTAIWKHEQKGLLSGVSVAHNVPKVCHLLFADDFVLFGHAIIGDCEVFWAILDDYVKASGHIVNFSKSLITWSAQM